MHKLTTIIFLILSLVASSSAIAIPLDFDQDGLSNPATVHIRPNENLAWRVKFATGNQTIDNNFGKSGNHIAVARYTTNAPQIATIAESGEWSIANAGTFTHGAENALYIAGADFDGNGQADVAFTTNACMQRSSRAFIRMNPFANNELKSLAVGRGYLYRLYMDANNDGRDDFCWTSPIEKQSRLTGRFQLICRDVQSKRRVARFSVRRIYANPVPLRNYLTADYLVAQRKRSSDTIVTVYNNRGKLIQRIQFNQVGTLVTGQFLSGNSEQIVIVNQANQGLLYNLETNTFSELTFPAGIPYDHFNVNYFSTKSNASACYCNSTTIARNRGACQKTNGGGGSKPNDNDGDGSNDNSQYVSFRDGNEGNLWKPVAESGYPEHNNKLVVLLHRSYQQVFDYCEVPLKNGQIHRLQVRPPYVFTNPDRQTWRATVDCNQVAEVFVSCYKGNNVVNFSVDPSSRSQVCSRHD